MVLSSFFFCKEKYTVYIKKKKVNIWLICDPEVLRWTLNFIVWFSFFPVLNTEASGSHPPLSWCITVQWGGKVHKDLYVEALSMQPKDEARLRQAGQLPPPAGHSPLPLPTLGSVLSHSWGDLLWQGLCFVRIWGAPGDQALSGDSLLSGLRCRTRSLWPAVFTSLPLPSASAVAPPCQLTKQIPCYFYFR